MRRTHHSHKSATQHSPSSLSPRTPIFHIISPFWHLTDHLSYHLNTQVAAQISSANIRSHFCVLQTILISRDYQKKLQTTDTIREPRYIPHNNCQTVDSCQPLRDTQKRFKPFPLNSARSLEPIYSTRLPNHWLDQDRPTSKYIEHRISNIYKAVTTNKIRFSIANQLSSECVIMKLSKTSQLVIRLFRCNCFIFVFVCCTML